MAKVAKEKQTKVKTRKDATYPGETLLEVSFIKHGVNHAGCLISIIIDDLGRPTIDIYRADTGIRVLVPAANLVQSAETL
jgi:hypothetical protein